MVSGTRARGVVGPWPSLHFLFHPLCCVPSSQGASGLPGSTGQKVMGLNLGEWVPGRSVGPVDMRRDVPKVFSEDGVWA